MLYTRVMTGSGEGERAEAERDRAGGAHGNYLESRICNYQPSTGSGGLCTYRSMKMSGSGTVGYRPFRVKRVRFEKDE